MRIIYYSPHPHLNLQDQSGYGTHMREMINAFRSLGHEVHPVIAGGTEKYLKNNSFKSDKTGIKEIIKNSMPSIIWESVKDFSLLKNDTRLGSHLEREVVNFKPDIIYERGSYLQASGAKVAQKNKLRHFIEINAPFVEERHSMQAKSCYASKAGRIEEFQIKNCSRLVVVSSALKKYFLEKYNLPAEKIIVTPNAIRYESIKTNDAEVEILKKKFLLLEKKVIGFVGSIFPYHGVDILIKAFKTVIEKEPACRLLIVGDGEILPDLKKAASFSGIGHEVIFTGQVKHTEIYNYINLMDICVMPQSNWYGSPVKIFEYGAMGKPIIAPDYAPLRDVMENNKHGVLIKPGENDLASAILKLLKDKLFSKSIAAEFQKKVLTEHRWESMSRKILDSYQK